MSNVETLSQSGRVLTRCPVLMNVGDEVIKCDALLTVTLSIEWMGAWANYSVDLLCGHNFRDMEQSIKAEEYL